MKRINRWIAKHAWFVYLLLSITICFGIFSFVYDFLGFVIGCLWVFACSLIIVRFVFSRRNVLMKEPLAVLLNQCDPYPWLEEVQRQRNYPGNYNLKFQRCVYEAMALRETGEYEQAYDLLRPLQKTALSKAHPTSQTMYCAEIYYLASKLGKMSELEDWHTKVVDAYEKLELISHRKQLALSMAAHMVRYYMVRQEYDAFIQELEAIPVRTLREQVVYAMNMACYYVAVDELENAKKELDFVIANGNKLYIVTEAKVLLEKINAEER